MPQQLAGRETMKSVAVLGLGVIALTTGAFVATPSSYFEAAVDGAVDARPSGGVAFGIVGDSVTGGPAFTITLGAEGTSGAILVTSLDSTVPAPGRYAVGEHAKSAAGFTASYVAGSAEHPSGLYRAERGTLEITASSAEHISGHFSFTGTGFTAVDPSDEGSEVTVDGVFTSTRPASVTRPAQP
jgi:hypothetical protein